MVFLLYQLTLASPQHEMGGIGGVQNSHTDYGKFLPKDIPLPTFYSDEERGMLVGTSLDEALVQKTRGLEREFETLRESTRPLRWCRKAWWGIEDDWSEGDEEDMDSAALRLADWKLVDALYRSRALELPQEKGIVMVPVIDMANHAPDAQYNARFETDADGNVMLVVRDGESIQSGQEINIMYGCGGACEMIFSYGFLDEAASSAREMFLSLSIPSDDPLRFAKIRFSDTAPGVRLYVDQTGEIRWDSDLVWWACVNEEDGLDFEILQSNDGQKELQAVWKGHEFEANDLKRLLLEDELRDIFALRSLVLVQQRVEQQGEQISDSEVAFAVAKHATGVRERTWELIQRLRKLELELLTAAYKNLESQVRLGVGPTAWTDSVANVAQKAGLLDTQSVRKYLGSDDGPVSGEEKESVADEDFS